MASADSPAGCVTRSGDNRYVVLADAEIVDFIYLSVLSGYFRVGDGVSFASFGRVKCGASDFTVFTDDSGHGCKAHNLRMPSTMSCPVRRNVRDRLSEK